MQPFGHANQLPPPTQASHLPVAPPSSQINTVKPLNHNQPTPGSWVNPKRAGCPRDWNKLPHPPARSWTNPVKPQKPPHPVAGSWRRDNHAIKTPAHVVPKTINVPPSFNQHKMYLQGANEGTSRIPVADLQPALPSKLSAIALDNRTAVPSEENRLGKRNRPSKSQSRESSKSRDRSLTPKRLAVSRGGIQPARANPEAESTHLLDHLEAYLDRQLQEIPGAKQRACFKGHLPIKRCI